MRLLARLLGPFYSAVHSALAEHPGGSEPVLKSAGTRVKHLETPRRSASMNGGWRLSPAQFWEGPNAAGSMLGCSLSWWQRLYSGMQSRCK